MKVPYSWLKEYVDIDLTPAELADKLVHAGFEIEEIIDESSIVTNVVVGKIVGMEKHPNADKLKVCYVKIGEENVDIVTNATNVNVGDLVPVALDGAHLANGMDIKKGELRGVMSEGMFCGPQELGLMAGEYPNSDVDAVLVLRESAIIGSNINDEIGKNEVILDIGLTANRADCNSIIGIAREVAAVTGVAMKPINLSYESVNRPIALSGVTVKNSALCPRYMAMQVDDVRIVESPEIIKTRLRKVGIRPINNIVDITNYVLIEIGQPMHAFDLSLLAEREIVVRNAENGEKITALDGNEYTMTSDMLAICDAEKIVAVAGVMGGEYSSIQPDTKRIIFESARFARDSVRLTSRALNLRSDSSARFEKGVDFYCQETGMKRALALISQYNYGTIIDDVIDTNPNVENNVVRTTVDKINAILGIEVPKDTIKSILTSLNFDTVINDNGDIISIVPLYREDIVGANDLAEEVIRIYGYSHLEPTLIKNAETVVGGRSVLQNNLLTFKNCLIGQGGHEIVTYSFVSPKIFDVLRVPEESELRNVIKIENPIGEDFSIMRTTLAYSMLKTLSLNYLRGNKEGRYFEIAKRYFPSAVEGERATETSTICFGAIGAGEDFYSIKEIVEILLEKCGITAQFVAQEISYMHPARTASILVGEEYLGYVGEVHPLVAKDFNIDKKLYLFELNADVLSAHTGKMLVFKPIPKYQAVERDLALLVDVNVNASDIVNTVLKSDKGIIESVDIFDVYQGGQVEEGKKSVAIKIVLRNQNATLTDPQVNEQIDKTLATLDVIIGAKLRS